MKSISRISRVAAASSAEASDSATRRQNEDQLEVTLAGVDQAGDGKLVVTTTDGALWRQVESEAIRPMPVQGQTMTIAATSFGGFMCKFGIDWYVEGLEGAVPK
jgi:hypothetical protein